MRLAAVFLLLLSAGPADAQTQILLSDPSAEACTSAVVTSVTVAWDAALSPQALPLIDGTGSVVWTLEQYILYHRVGPEQGQPVVVFPSLHEATITVSPPGVACVTIRASGSVPLTPSPALKPPTGLIMIGVTNPPPITAYWASLCDVTGTLNTGLVSSCGSGANVPAARGFAWRLPFDSVNGEFLLLHGNNLNTTIYSTDLWTISARTNQMVKRVTQSVPAGENGCGPGRNPVIGHPRGFAWFDSGIGQWFAQAALCQGESAGFTSRYQASTRTMLSLLPVWMQSPAADGQYQGGQHIDYDSGAEYVAGYGRAIVCCGDNMFWLRVVEFDSATSAYTSVSSQVRASDGTVCDANVLFPKPVSADCPILTYGSGLASDATSLWVFGGRNDSTGNKNLLFRYTPTTKVIVRMAPVDSVLPPATNAVFPMYAFDSRRNRLLFYAGTNDLWQYSIASNRWSQVQSLGNGPVFDAFLTANSNGNAAGYDPVADAMVVVYSRGQSTAPGVFILRFGG